jgi:hypothetical protein
MATIMQDDRCSAFRRICDSTIFFNGTFTGKCDGLTFIYQMTPCFQVPLTFSQLEEAGEGQTCFRVHQITKIDSNDGPGLLRMLEGLTSS